MISEGKVGSIVGAAASINPLVTNVAGALAVVAAGGKYAEAALAGRIFMACNQTHVTTCTTMHATFTGLAIVNPANSGKNYIMHEFSYAMMDSPSGDTNLSLIITPVHTGYAADITVRCGMWGKATSSAIADAAATVTASAGTLVKHIGTLGTNITTDLISAPTVVDLGGAIIVPPGYAIATDTLLASGNVMLFGFMWEEVDA